MMAKSCSMVLCGILLVNNDCLGSLYCTSVGKPAVIKTTTSVCQSALETLIVLKGFVQWGNTCIFPRDPKKPQKRPKCTPVQPQTTYRQEGSAGAVWLVLGKALFWPWRGWPPAAVRTILCWLVRSGHRESSQELSSKYRWASAQRHKWSLLSWARQKSYCQIKISTV